MTEDEWLATLILIVSVSFMLYPMIKLYKSTDKDLEDLRKDKS